MLLNSAKFRGILCIFKNLKLYSTIFCEIDESQGFRQNIKIWTIFATVSQNRTFQENKISLNFIKINEISYFRENAFSVQPQPLPSPHGNTRFAHQCFLSIYNQRYISPHYNTVQVHRRALGKINTKAFVKGAHLNQTLVLASIFIYWCIKNLKCRRKIQVFACLFFFWQIRSTQVSGSSISRNWFWRISTCLMIYLETGGSR